jgi:hypothetical protein
MALSLRGRIARRIKREFSKLLPTRGIELVWLERFRDVLSDPLNLLIERDTRAGQIAGNQVVLHNGLVVPFRGRGAYYSEFSDILVINRGVHEPLEEFAFQELLGKLGAAGGRLSMLELGAYWGHYSMWFKQRFPDAFVSLLEPDARGLEAGRQNFARNGLVANEFIPATVGVGKWTVDGYLGGRRLTILHSDIQGAEREMLDGAAGSLDSKAIDYLFVSTHSQELHEGVVQRLEGFGYVVEANSDLRETTSYDGFVMARNPARPAVLPNFRPLGCPEIREASPAKLLASISIAVA